MIFRPIKVSTPGEYTECFYLMPEADGHTHVGDIRKINGYWWFLPATLAPLPCKCLRDIAERLSELNTQ